MDHAVNMKFNVFYPTYFILVTFFTFFDVFFLNFNPNVYYIYVF